LGEPSDAPCSKPQADQSEYGEDEQAELPEGRHGGRRTESRGRRAGEGAGEARAAARPAIQPVVHAAWKLKPPVMPSMSSTSPAKCRPGTSRLSIVLKSTSRRRIPPQVTNSSLFRLLPSTWNAEAPTCPASFCRWLFDTPAHWAAGASPGTAATRRSQRREGREKGLSVETCLRGLASRQDWSAAKACSGV